MPWSACRSSQGVGRARTSQAAVAALTALAVTVQPAPVAAQNSTARPAATSSRGRLAVTGCSGQPISDIVVITQPPFADRLPARLEWVRHTVRRLHANTRDDVVRRFMVLKVGEPCNQIARAESERMLRAQPYLVDARIRAYDDEQGGVRLEVETRDDVSLLFSPMIVAVSPYLRALQIGEGNIGGRAQRGLVRWRDNGLFRDTYGVEYTNFLFGAARNELRLRAEQNDFGHYADLLAIRPYYTDLQRAAWVAGLGVLREPTWLTRAVGDGFAVMMDREFAQLGGLVRFGPVGRLKLLGASLTREVERTDPGLVRFTRQGFVPDTTGTTLSQLRPQNVVRANALLGLRNIRFVRVQGFDALTGAQDVRVGAQFGLVAGHSLPIAANLDRDRFLSSNLYVGAGTEKWFLGAQGITEARYGMTDRKWSNMVASGRAAWYFRPAVRQTTVMQAEWSAARDMHLPIQLTLADHLGGILGHWRSQDAGASRVVFRGEQRLVIPTRLNVADLGFAGFAEAGRLFSDPSVPFSVTTPWRGAVGLSVLAALPPRSRRMWRVDFAMPVGTDPNRQFQIRFSGNDRSRVFWQEPWDIERARERTAPSSLFTWP
jgi:hypothetical protein